MLPHIIEQLLRISHRCGNQFSGAGTGTEAIPVPVPGESTQN